MSQYVVKQISLEDEYKKNTGITPPDIANLRQWLVTQPHMPANYITDLELILIYHSCDRSVEVTKQVIELNYTMRTHFHVLFKDREVNQTVINTLNVVLMQGLSTRAKDDSAVFYTHLLDYEPKNLYYADFVRVLVMLVELWQYEEGTWPGFVVVFDLEGFKLGHITRVDLHAVQEILAYFQDAMLVKLKSMHFLNAPPFTDKLIMLIKPFIKKELMEAIYIHQAGSHTIEEFVPIEALPKEAGGKYRSFEECKELAVQRLQANSQYFIEENKKRVTESLRPGRPKTITDIFGGVEGSFKKLEID